MSNNNVKPDKTWAIYDSSKVQAYMECPRKYFYRYVLGWETEDTSKDLVFGEAWHRVMETLLIEGYNNQAVKKAYERFIAYYRQHFTELQDANNYPKSPASVVPALVEYMSKYRTVDKFEVLYTEIAGTVAISDKRTIHFRLDSIVKGDEGIFSLEHKTGSRLGQTWIDQWTMKIQVGTYTHVLYSLYDPKDVYGIKINGVIFRKKGNAYIRVPIRKSVDMMNVWLWNINHFIDLIEWNMNEMMETTEDEVIMPAFPINSESCTKWGRPCEYLDFCSVWANPLQHCDEPPTGLIIRYWDPSEREEDSDTVMHIKQEEKE